MVRWPNANNVTAEVSGIETRGNAGVIHLFLSGPAGTHDTEQVPVAMSVTAPGAGDVGFAAGASVTMGFPPHSMSGLRSEGTRRTYGAGELVTRARPGQHAPTCEDTRAIRS